MQLNWNKCDNNTVWCDLNRVNLDHEHFKGLEGVYIIWHTGTNPATVRVGQGVIRDRLSAHRNDNEVQAYVSYGLRVTWASLSESFRDGVEAYLAKTLKPLVGHRFPEATPIEVNLHW